MAAGELPVSERVPIVAECTDDPTATPVDRQHPVRRAVGDEDAGAAVPEQWRHEPGGEGEHRAEEIAIGQAQGKGVGGAVGEAGDRDARRLDRKPLEHVGQRGVEPDHVRAVSADDHVPGGSRGLRREEQEAVGSRLRTQPCQGLLG
jgi:hypothetical protein